MNVFPPLTWARKINEWWAEKPKYQWTLGSNPIVGAIMGKDGEGKPKSFMTMKLSRGGRLLERTVMGVGIVGALMLGPAGIPWLGVTAGSLTAPLVGQVLFNLKVNAFVMGIVGEAVVRSGKFLLQMYDQILNGPDDAREALKYQKQMKKLEKQSANRPGGVTPSFDGQQPKVHAEPSVIDKMIALGHAFNGRAGQMTASQQQALNTVIWGDNSQSPNAPQPGNGQQYEEAFKVPTEDTVRIASSGREGAWQHDHHIGSAPPQQQHHHNPEPPAPAYKPPGCDNN